MLLTSLWNPQLFLNIFKFELVAEIAQVNYSRLKTHVKAEPVMTIDNVFTEVSWLFFWDIFDGNGVF